MSTWEPLLWVLAAAAAGALIGFTVTVGGWWIIGKWRNRKHGS